MPDEGAPLGSLKPREPEDHDLTGTGTPRSADTGLSGSQPETPVGSDPAVETGGTTSSQPAFSDEVAINRSGSGGSGGPAEQSDDLEGSTGESMSELLSGEGDSESPVR